MEGKSGEGRGALLMGGPGAALRVLRRQTLSVCRSRRSRRAQCRRPPGTPVPCCLLGTLRGCIAGRARLRAPRGCPTSRAVAGASVKRAVLSLLIPIL